MTRARPMTLEEASRIRDNVRSGALDLQLPGTQDVVRQAERTCARADLWGSTAQDRRRSAAGVVLIVVSTVLAVTVALGPVPL